MEVELIAMTRYLGGNGTPEELIEHAGRACYRSRPKGDPGDFVGRRVREGHESIIEHASATFDIRGISRACSHQLVRHRIASYSQESQRYVDMSEPEYVSPPSISDNETASQVFAGFMETVASAYQQLRAEGVKKEDARFVLPNATATRIIVTMNFRSWRHVIRERGLNPAAQWEIRELANRVLDILSEVAPNVFQDLVDERERLRASGH